MKYIELLELNIKWDMKPYLSMIDLEKYADLLCLDLYDVLEKTVDVKQKVKELKSYIKKFDFKEDDLNSIAQFHRVIKNYTKMNEYMKKMET